MEFTIVSHACLDVRAKGKRLVIDPWLNEPTYWSAWWHAPPPVFDDGIFNADYIYITHWHFDHFDPRTLKKFSKQTTVMVPKFPISGLPDQLRNVGFERIIELDHGKTIRLADGFEFTSYQITFQDDSAAVIQADSVTLFDLNDSKPLPSTWKTFRTKYPKVDFMLRSHSPAWSYPTRYTFEEPRIGCRSTQRPIWKLSSQRHSSFAHDTPCRLRVASVICIARCATRIATSSLRRR